MPHMVEQFSAEDLYCAIVVIICSGVTAGKANHLLFTILRENHAFQLSPFPRPKDGVDIQAI